MLLESKTCLRGTSRGKNFQPKTTLSRRVNWQANTGEVALGTGREKSSTVKGLSFDDHKAVGKAL